MYSMWHNRCDGCGQVHVMGDARPSCQQCHRCKVWRYPIRRRDGSWQMPAACDCIRRYQITTQRQSFHHGYNNTYKTTTTPLQLN